MTLPRIRSSKKAQKPVKIKTKKAGYKTKHKKSGKNSKKSSAKNSANTTRRFNPDSFIKKDKPGTTNVIFFFKEKKFKKKNLTKIYLSSKQSR